MKAARKETDRSAPVTQRRATRDLVDFKARATSRSGPHDVQIVNVSPLGLMARVASPLAAGDHLLIELPHVRRIESVVRWAEDGRIGVEFAQAIEADHYAMMLAFMPQRQNGW